MKRILTIGFILFFASQLHAQFQASSLPFGDLLPQNQLTNPAIMPQGKIVIGLPGLSSYYLDMNAPASLSDIYEKQGNTGVIDLSKFSKGLGNRFGTSARADAQVFYIGFRTTSSYLSFNIRAHSEFQFYTPSELIRWAAEGPAASGVSNTIDLSDIDTFGLSYVEAGASWATSLSSNVKFGLRVRYISGMVSARGEQDGFVHISGDSASVYVQNLNYQVAGLTNIENDNFSKLVFGGNSGVGVDLGVQVNLSSFIKMDVSVSDLGIINWKEGVSNFDSKNVGYTFKGYNIDELFFGQTSDIAAELDSIATRLEPKRTEGGSFRTGLNPKFNASFSYKLGRHNTVSAVLYSAYNQGNIDPVIGVSHTLSLGQTFHLLTGVAYKNNKFDNITAGFILKPGPVQLYFMTDKFNGLFLPARSSSINLRFGLNLVIGNASVMSY